MRCLRNILMLVLVVAIAMPTLAQERIDSGIRFNDLYGDVNIRPDSEEDDAYEYAELDTIIYENDRIRTKEESGAILGFEDLSTFVIKPESILIINKDDKKTTKLEMVAGRIWGNVKKMTEGQAINCEMSQCVAGIKGTIWKMEESANGNINKISVINGLVEVTSKQNGKVYSVPSGQNFTITSNGEVATETIKIDEEKKELFNDLLNMENKSNIDNLIEKIKDKTSKISLTNSSFKSRYEDLNKQLSALEVGDNNSLKALSENIGALKLEASRYRGELEEAGVTVVAAQARKIEDKKVAINLSTIALRLKVTCENTGKTIAEIFELDLKCQKLLNSVSSKNNTHKVGLDNNAIEDINIGIEAVYNEAKEIIAEISDGSSYSDIKDARESCERYLNILSGLSSTLAKIPVEPENQKAMNETKAKYENSYKYIQRAIRNFGSVPEINNGLVANIKDIEKIVPSYASDVRKYLKEYNAIEKNGSVDSKKRYVETVTRMLTSYDRMGRQYTKANRMYTQVEKNFKNSSFKTSEYNEVKESWDRIEEAMTALDSEASELSSCLENLKSQLEAIIGQ